MAQNKYIRITRCRACGGKLTSVISLGKQTSVGFTDKPEKGTRVPLTLVICVDCRLVQLQHTTDPSLLYNENYGYRSGVNETMVAELADIVDNVGTKDGDIVVDIGCNDGTLLSNYPVDVYRVGFDPSLGTTLLSGNNLATYCFENLSKGGAKFKIFKEYFNAISFKRVFGKKKASVVTSIAMFYDLENPNQFLQDVFNILDDKGTFIIQQNYLVGMLNQLAYDNICHEHLEYYSLTSLEPLLNKNGFTVIDVEERKINGGSFRVYCQKYGTPTLAVQKMRDREKRLKLDTMKPYKEFAKNVKENATLLRKAVKMLVKEDKKVYVYGASTRGNSLLQVAKIDNKLISGAAERNPTKYGKYTAGTKIKIVSEEEARQKADFFLCLPWFFRDSFIEREKEFVAGGGHLIFPLPDITVI